LYSDGSLLTSEAVRHVIARCLLDASCVGERTIVSCGAHTTDPHETGRGPLFAHRPIILDIFPQHTENRYWADFTRTVVRGKASGRLKKMYSAVKTAQDAAMARIKPGADASAVHAAVNDVLLEAGFRTEKRHGRMQGFFHSTGHGLGLEIHEDPRIGPRQENLVAGNVITVEPGLYYSDEGGIRLEDLVVVTRTGCRNLTRFPKKLEI
jgi:Xaa-Pro aminopeptidase